MTYSGDRERHLQLAQDHDRETRRRERRAAAAAIRRRLVAHIAAGGTTDFAPAVLENEAACYTDPRRAELERRTLFLGLPLVVGLSSDIPSAGDLLVFEEAGPSILVVRGDDGVVRAFLNMCRHRASKLVDARPDGTCSRHSRLSCPFHAWTYDLTGALAGIPGRAGFDGLDAEAQHLVPVPAAEWHGLIFVRAGGGTEPLDARSFLGGFADELRHVDFEDAAPVRHSRLTAACNWKMALDTYAEAYHFATLHASSIGVSHYSNIAVFDDFAPHWRMNVPEKPLRTLVGLPESEWPDVAYGGIHFVFPNTVMVVGALDVAHQIEVLGLIHELSARSGIAAVVVIHEINMAARFCDEILALKDGRLIARGAPAHLMTAARLHAIYDVTMGVLPHPDTGEAIAYVRR